MMKLFIVAHAGNNRGKASQNGVNGRAANGQSLRRQGNETMGEYLRRTGESVVGATSRTRGTPARVAVGSRTRGRNA